MRHHCEKIAAEASPGGGLPWGRPETGKAFNRLKPVKGFFHLRLLQVNLQRQNEKSPSAKAEGPFPVSSG
jgi:hypothetical protein